jgi:hypothetical protein
MTALELDGRILAAVRAWHAGDGEALGEAEFERLALDLFSYQVGENAPYRRFCERLGFGGRRVPETWRQIPAVPSSAFRDATLVTFDAAHAELEFHTSGTTSPRSGKHYMQRAALYDAALAAGFDRFMLADGARLRYLNLVPDPRERPHSSLGYMMKRVGEVQGRESGFYLHGETIDVDGFRRDLRGAIGDGEPVCIAGTAFALVALLDALEASGEVFACAGASRIMETGGFKGRTRDVPRDELYDRLSRRLGIPQERIVAEYGMTELTSQYYDSAPSRTSAVRVKAGPPWLRAIVVDSDGREVTHGETGLLRHFDLANRSSVVAVATEDAGYAEPGGFVLLGRAAAAALRGCSLDAEDLVAPRG